MKYRLMTDAELHKFQLGTRACKKAECTTCNLRFGKCPHVGSCRVVGLFDIKAEEFFSLPEEVRYEINKQKCRALGITFVEVE